MTFYVPFEVAFPLEFTVADLTYKLFFFYWLGLFYYLNFIFNSEMVYVLEG
jgi:hypothetical protein